MLFRSPWEELGKDAIIRALEHGAQIEDLLEEHHHHEHDQDVYKRQGLNTAVYMGIGLIYLIIGSSLMTFTTTPNALTDGIEELLDPLKKIHVCLLYTSRCV